MHVSPAQRPLPTHDGPVLQQAWVTPPQTSTGGSMSGSMHVPERPSPAFGSYRRPLSHAVSGKLQYPVDSHVPERPPDTHCSEVAQTNGSGRLHAHASIAITIAVKTLTPRRYHRPSLRHAVS